MSSLKFAFLFIALSNVALAATPFTHSGTVLSAVFSSSSVWSKVSGAVKSTEHLGYDRKTKTHSILFVTETCEFTAKVRNIADDMVPAWKTTTTTLEGCL